MNKGNNSNKKKFNKMNNIEKKIIKRREKNQIQ